MATTESVAPPQEMETVLPASAWPLSITPDAFSAASILLLLATVLRATDGAVLSYTKLVDACVAVLPAASDTFAVTATEPASSPLTSTESNSTLHPPPAATVAVSDRPPTVTVTICPSAPLLVPEIVRADSSSASFKYPPEIGVVMATDGAVVSITSVPAGFATAFVALSALPAASARLAPPVLKATTARSLLLRPASTV